MGKPVLPTDPTERKGIPVVSGVLDYFPAALAEVARVSKAGNDQHNPGQPLHWARGKSTDQADTLVRHLMERGTVDTDGMRHSAKLAWRALALLQIELEEAGLAPVARGARLPEDPLAALREYAKPLAPQTKHIAEYGRRGDQSGPETEADAGLNPAAGIYWRGKPEAAFEYARGTRGSQLPLAFNEACLDCKQVRYHERHRFPEQDASLGSPPRN